MSTFHHLTNTGSPKQGTDNNILLIITVLRLRFSSSAWPNIMKNLSFMVSFLVSVFPVTVYGENIYSHAQALEFYSSIIRTDPLNQHLVKTRRYSIEDINNDEKLEVLVYINQLNENTEGLVNVELYPALEWIDIYSFQNGAYIKTNRNFQWYLQQRKIFYEFWLRTVQNPAALNEDSREWLNTEDKELVLKAIKANLAKIDALIE